MDDLESWRKAFELIIKGVSACAALGIAGRWTLQATARCYRVIKLGLEADAKRRPRKHREKTCK
jgi:hypothetical protein